MGQLRTQEDPFEFLTKTKMKTLNDVKEYIISIYLDSLRYIPYSNAPEYINIIPTRFMIISTASDYIEDLYYDYGKNGHCPSALKEIQDFERNNPNMYDESELVGVWSEFRFRNENFYFGSDKEKMLFRDINKALSLFSLSYMMDENEAIYTPLQEFKPGEIINSPIVEVW